MYEHRSDYICGYTRRYYGHTILLAYAQVGEDPFLAVAYFTAPTRDYLRKHNLSFTPRTQHYLRRYVDFSPDGSLWQGIAASRGHIPCGPSGNVAPDPGERL